MLEVRNNSPCLKNIKFMNFVKEFENLDGSERKYMAYEII